MKANDKNRTAAVEMELAKQPFRVTAFLQDFSILGYVFPVSFHLSIDIIVHAISPSLAVMLYHLHNICNTILSALWSVQ
jgi:hypothetical protein